MVGGRGHWLPSSLVVGPHAPHPSFLSIRPFGADPQTHPMDRVDRGCSRAAALSVVCWGSLLEIF